MDLDLKKKAKEIIDARQTEFLSGMNTVWYRFGTSLELVWYNLNHNLEKRQKFNRELKLKWEQKNPKKDILTSSSSSSDEEPKSKKTKIDLVSNIGHAESVETSTKTTSSKEIGTEVGQVGTEAGTNVDSENERLV